jgi:hypothetical protein
MKSEDKYFVSDEQFEEIYQLIKKTVVSQNNATPVPLDEKPLAVVLGGQPGAGKSNVYTHYEDVLPDSIVGIDCDAFREYHPCYVQIYEDCQQNGGNPSEITNPFIYAISDRLVAELSEERYNMVIESTLRTPDVAKNFVEKVWDDGVDFRLKDKGYEVHLAVVGTHKDISLQGTIGRYEKQLQKYNSGESDVPPRFIPPEFHNSVVGSICDSLRDVYESGLMDEIRIFGRSGDCFYSMRSTPDIDPTPVLSDKINHPVELLNDLQKFNQFMQLQGCMYDKGVNAALESFGKGRTFKLSTHDWRLSEVNPEDLIKELELDETKPLDRGLAMKFVSAQSITDCIKELGIPEDKARFTAVRSGYISAVDLMIHARLEEGSRDKVDLVMKDNSFFQSLDTKQKLCFLEHCRADASKALEATGRTIENLTNSNPHK